MHHKDCRIAVSFNLVRGTWKTYLQERTFKPTLQIMQIAFHRYSGSLDEPRGSCWRMQRTWKSTDEEAHLGRALGDQLRNYAKKKRKTASEFRARKEFERCNSSLFFGRWNAPSWSTVTVCTGHQVDGPVHAELPEFHAVHMIRVRACCTRAISLLDLSLSFHLSRACVWEDDMGVSFHALFEHSCTLEQRTVDSSASNKRTSKI